MAKDYNISKSAGHCIACEKPLEVGQEYMATLREADEELLREDFCLPCWQARDAETNGDLLGLWRARVPEPEQKKKTFVDDEIIVNFFQRLEDAEEEAKVNFRFVLALVLMRKKLLIYERSTRTDDGHEVWTVRLKGTDQTAEVVDPHMDEDKIAEISGQLGQIMEGEL